MSKLWVNPVVVGMIGLMGLATSPLRSLTVGRDAGRGRWDAHTARLASERAFASWSFDEDRQVWMPNSLRR